LESADELELKHGDSSTNTLSSDATAAAGIIATVIKDRTKMKDEAGRIITFVIHPSGPSSVIMR